MNRSAGFIHNTVQDVRTCDAVPGNKFVPLRNALGREASALSGRRGREPAFGARRNKFHHIRADTDTRDRKQ